MAVPAGDEQSQDGDGLSGEFELFIIFLRCRALTLAQTSSPDVVSPAEWESFLRDDGSIRDWPILREMVYRRGIAASVRVEVRTYAAF